MVKQYKYHNCGECCIRSLIQIIYKKNCYGYLKVNECSSFLDMKEELNHYGITSAGYEYSSFKDLKKLKNFILSIKKGEKNHFVIVRKVLLNFIFIYDPEVGHKLVSKRWIESKANKYVLLVEKVEKKDLKQIKLYRNNELLYSLGLAFLKLAMLILIYLSFFYFNQKYLLPIFAFLVVIFEWFDRSNLLSIHSRLGREIVSPYLELNPNRENYLKGVNFQNKVTKSLSLKIDFITSAILVLFLAINVSVVFLVLLSLTLVTSLLIYLFFSRTNSKLNSEINILDQRLFLEGEYKRENFILTEEKSVKIGEYYLLERGFICVFALLFSFLMFSNTSGEFNYQYFLISFALFSFVGIKVLDFFFKKDKFSSIDSYLLELDESIYDIQAIYKINNKSKCISKK